MTRHHGPLSNCQRLGKICVVLQMLHVYDGVHTAGIWFGHMPAAWHYYDSYMWLNHTAAIMIPYGRRIYYAM